MKNFELNLKVNEIRYGETIERTYKAEINLTDDTTFSEIIDFLEGIKKVWGNGMVAIKAGFCMELEVIEAVYKNYGAPEKDLIQESFNRWVSVPTPNQDNNGIYLKPDTRYTDKCRYMYLSKDTLKDLAFTLH